MAASKFLPLTFSEPASRGESAEVTSTKTCLQYSSTPSSGKSLSIL